MATIDTSPAFSRATSTSTPPTVTTEATLRVPSASTRWTWSSSSATWRRPARSTSASPRGLSPCDLVAYRLAVSARRVSTDLGPAAIRLRGLLVSSSLRLCRKRPRVGFVPALPEEMCLSPVR